MFASHGVVPRPVGLFLVECQPTRDDFVLLVRQGPCQQFSVNPDCGLILSVLDMNMGLVVLSDIVKQQINHHSPESA